MSVRGAESTPDRKARRALAKFETVYDHVRRMYVDSVDMSPLVEEAIREMFRQLDPHTEYSTADEMTQFREMYQGQFSGIGVTTMWLRDSLVVIAVQPGEPADQAGIRIDDRMVRIDGQKVAANPYKQLRGDVGSEVKIEVVRRDSLNPITYNITRRKITIPSVDLAYRVDSTTGYIKLTRFSQTTMQEFNRAYAQLGPVENLILDLRGNGGGLFQQAIALSNFFLPKGVRIVSIEGRGISSVSNNARQRPVFPEQGRLVVLIDERSASASEVVSGALQDWDRAVIVGRRSFGKGLVQRQYLLNDGSSIRLVIARYHTPSGRVIQRPYVKGEDRSSYVNQELPDSIPALAYKTLRTGRTVYGGGGITPDVIVPQDTIGMVYLNSIVQQNVLQQFIQDYLDQNRKSLNERYPDVETFDEQFEITPALYEELTRLGQIQGVIPPPVDSAAERQTKQRLKALLVERLFGEEAFWRMWHARDDAEFLRALEIIRNGNTDEILSGKK